MESVTEIHKPPKYREYLTAECTAPIGTSTHNPYRWGSGISTEEETQGCQNRGPGGLPWGNVFYVLMASYTREILVVWLPKQDPHNDKASWHVNMGWGKSHRAPPLNIQLHADERESISPGTSLIIGNPKQSSLPICTYEQHSNELSRIYVCVCVCR